MLGTLVRVALPFGVCAAIPRPLARGVEGPILQEPAPQEHFAWLRNYVERPLAEFEASEGPPILRVTDLDDETFQQLVRDGSPFVVDDCTRGFDEDAIDKLECKDFADRWPTGNMRAEYTPGQYHIFLKDPRWHTKVEPQRSHVEHMAKEKKIAGPYIWHVKDEEPLETKRSVQKHWRTPYFLDRSMTNRIEANESFEFWFSLAGGGTFTHADAYCETTISMQFKGRKRWRVQSFPRVRHFLNASSFGDEQIYDHKQHVSWTPETEFTVGPGQCLIFPTGYLHETYVDPADNDAGCYTASTFQFNHPRQVNLYRAYLSSFSMSHYGMGEPCLRTMTPYATLLDSVKFKGEPDKEQLRSEAQRLVTLVDADKDERLTRDELYAHFCTGKKQRTKVLKKGGFQYNWIHQLSAQQKEELIEEAVSVWAEDALQYHDLNRDRFLTVEELAYNFLHWGVVQHRAAQMQASNNKAKKPAGWLKAAVKGEAKVLSKHFCEDAAACKVADELVAYGESLQKTGDGAIAKKMRKVLGMFESEERGGNEETLTMLDRETGDSNRVKVGHLNAKEL